jgi:O-antigen ligase
MSASIFVTSDVRQTLWSGAARTTGLALYLICFVWFIGVRLHDFDKDMWKKYLVLSVGVAGLASMWSLFDMFILADAGMAAGQTRLSVPAGNALILATYLAPYLFIIAFLLADRASFKLKQYHYTVLGISGVFITIATIFTFTRSSYLGIAAGIIAGLVGYGLMIRQEKNSKTFRHVVIATLALFIGFSSFYLYAVKTNLGGGRLKINTESFLTLKTRLLNWKIAFRSIQEHPVLGVGWENYRTAVDRLFDPTLATYSYYETRIDKPHNAIIEIWVTLGTIGLIVYLFLVYQIGATAWRLYTQNKITRAGFWTIIGFITAYQVQNLFSFDTPQTLFTQGLVFAFLTAHDESYRQFSVQYFSKIRSILITIAIMVFSVIFYYAGWAPIRTLWLVNKGLVASQQHDFDTVDSTLRRAFVGTQGPYYFETWRWFAESLLKKYADGSLKLSELTQEQRVRWEEDVVQIVALTEKYGNENQDSFEWQTFAGKVSYVTALAKNDKLFLANARKYFMNAYKISFVRQEPPLLLAYISALEGDNAQAIEWYTAAIKLSPSAETASALDWLVNRLVSEKDLNNAIHVLEKSVEIAPNAMDYARLAAAYASVSQYADAEKAVKKAVEIDSTFAEEAQRFISGFPKK